MTKPMLTSAIIFSICFAWQTANATSAQAQCASCGDTIDGGVVAESVGDYGGACESGSCGSGGCLGCKADYSVRNEDGMIQPTTRRHMTPTQTLKYAAKDHFSPHRVYAYSKHGMAAGHLHAWNKQQAAATPWHGNWSHWRWGTPTALVVPANSSYQTNYAWGVGQTTSTPLYHQFGRGNAGVTYGAGFGMSPSQPYYPSSTNQFGIYSVRAPW